jgi:hypothetical protein
MSSPVTKLEDLWGKPLISNLSQPLKRRNGYDGKEERAQTKVLTRSFFIKIHFDKKYGQKPGHL